MRLELFDGGKEARGVLGAPRRGFGEKLPASSVSRTPAEGLEVGIRRGRRRQQRRGADDASGARRSGRQAIFSRNRNRAYGGSVYNQYVSQADRLEIDRRIDPANDAIHTAASPRAADYCVMAGLARPSRSSVNSLRDKEYLHTVHRATIMSNGAIWIPVTNTRHKRIIYDHDLANKI